MQNIYSENKKGLLLHCVIRKAEIAGRQNLIADNEFLQVSTLGLQAEDTFKAHIHLWKDVDFTQYLAQESWVVISGEIEVSFFDTDGKLLETVVLGEGDSSVTLHGGHSYRAVKESLVYEFKSGPYRGVNSDKKQI
jgi:hypothetical protein